MQTLNNSMIFYLTNNCTNTTTHTKEKLSELHKCYRTSVLRITCPGFPFERLKNSPLGAMQRRTKQRRIFQTWEIQSKHPHPNHSKEQSACLFPWKLKERTGKNKVQLNFFFFNYFVPKALLIFLPTLQSLCTKFIP